MAPPTPSGGGAPAPLHRTPGVGPSLPYPVKAAVTSVRSAAWHARTLGGRTGGDDGLRILFYHRVSDDPDPLAVTPRRFAAQMAHLAQHGYRVVGVPEIGRLLDAGRAPSRTIGLAFDDGFRDVADHGLPVLERHGFQATVYLPTGVIDGRARFAWYAEQPPTMSWAQVVELDGDSPLAFEAHTVTHPSLLLVDDARARHEIAASRSELEDRLGREVTSFCYPAGLFGERERRLVEAAGYRTGSSCEPGVNHPGTDRFALRRRQIDARDRMLDFRAKVGGGHDTPLPLRATYRRWRYGMGAGVGSPRRASSRA